MKNLLTIAGLLFCLSPTTVFATGFAKELGVTAAEIWFQYFPQRGYIVIREYNLSIVEGAEPLGTLEELVPDANYCDTHFGFTQLETLQERIFLDRGYATAECHLVVRTNRIDVSIQDLLSGILNRPVTTTSEGVDMGIGFEGDDIAMGSSNSKGLLGKDNMRMIFWGKDLDHFEAVLIRKDADTWGLKSLSTKLKHDLESPELSREEMTRRRDSIQ